MKAPIKQYLSINPALAGELNTNIVELLKNAGLKKNKIISINVHNYLMQTELGSKKKMMFSFLGLILLYSYSKL